MDLEVLMAPASIPSMAGISPDRWRRLSFKPRDQNGETERALRSTSSYFEAKREALWIFPFQKSLKNVYHY